ncbi:MULTISPECIES: hypothetical protein [unclassified Microcoleus]|uniref:hypothetical protein n=1 Tax=unclassified Microcoleus TaxID=2642155 RepID=UPI002FD10260
MQSLNLADIQPFLDNPEQLANQSISFQISVTNYLPTPRNLLEVLVNSSNSQVAEAARLHVNWGGEITEDWQEVADAVLRNAQLEQNDRLAVELLKFAPVPDYFLSEWVPANPLLEGLRNPYLPNRFRLKIFERLSREPSLEPRLQMTELADAPLAILEQLAGDLELPIRLAVQYNPNCPTELILRVESQHNAAQDWNTEPQQLATLAESSWSWVRLAVAQNPHASPEVLVKLAGDAYEKIQLAVAINPASPEGAIAMLANHPENSVRDAVAKHPNASEATLLQLLPSYSNVIINRNNLPISVLEQLAGDRNLHYSLLKQPNLPGAILAQMLDSSSESNRAKIAEHPQVLASTLEQLARDADPKVRLAVAQNLNTPDALRSQLLQQLATESDEKIRVAVASHPSTPIPVLEELVNSTLYGGDLWDRLHQYISNESQMQEIRTLLDIAPATQLLFWLNQDPNLRQPILQQWEQIAATVSEQKLQELGRLSALMIGMSGGTGMMAGVNSILRQRDDLLPLYGLLILLSWGDNARSRSILVALAGNPNTPPNALAKLQQIDPQAESGNWRVRVALGYNRAISEAQRIEYLQQAIASGWGDIRETIAKNPNTPVFILEQLAQYSTHIVQAIAANPNAPVSILRQAAQQDNSSTLKLLAKNPSTPTDILEELALNKGKDGVREEAFKNPNLDPLIIYRFELESQAAEEIAKANEFFASRLHSPYAIAQVLRNGDLASRMKIARDRRTPVNILEQLARDPDESVRQVVVNNPNLPLSIHLELTHDPSDRVRRALATKSSGRSTPVEILEQLANDKSDWVRELVAENPETPLEILVQLANDSSPQVKAKVVANRNTPVEILERLGLQERIFNKNNPNTPGSVLAAAATRARSNSNPDPLVDLLKYPVKGSQMPASTLEELATHRNTSVRLQVAEHPNTPASALEKLASDPVWYIRTNVCQHPNTSTGVLEALLMREDPNGQDYHRICNSLASRKDPPPSILERLASDRYPQIRGLAALCSNTPLTILERLATNESNEDVLQSLIRNRNLTLQLLWQLAQNPNPKVRIYVIESSKITPEVWALLARDEDVAVRLELAERSHCPITILEVLASDENKDVRQKVAVNRNTPAIALEILATDVDAAVRTAVANRNTPAPALEQLAQDRRVEVRLAVSRNPNKPASVGESLRELQPPTRQVSPTLRGLSRIYNPNTDDLPSLLSEYVQSSRPFVWFVALMHPLTPAEALRQGSESVSWLERYAVANNPATPPEIRQLLAEDSNRIVRATAKAYL